MRIAKKFLLLLFLAGFLQFLPEPVHASNACQSQCEATYNLCTGEAGSSYFQCLETAELTTNCCLATASNSFDDCQNDTDEWYAQRIIQCAGYTPCVNSANFGYDTRMAQCNTTLWEANAACWSQWDQAYATCHNAYDLAISGCEGTFSSCYTNCPP
jgi:hypothetical protein